MDRPVVVQHSLEYQAVSDPELEVGMAYAKKAYEKDIDKDLLRLIVNTTMRRRTPQVKLAFLTASVVRENIKLTNKEQAPKIDAYKGAAMKIMSQRSVWKRRRDAQKRAAGIPVPPAPKQVEHPLDSRTAFAGQYRLFS